MGKNAFHQRVSDSSNTSPRYGTTRSQYANHHHGNDNDGTLGLIVADGSYCDSKHLGGIPRQQPANIRPPRKRDSQSSTTMLLPSWLLGKMTLRLDPMMAIVIITSLVCLLPINANSNIICPSVCQCSSRVLPPSSYSTSQSLPSFNCSSQSRNDLMELLTEFLIIDSLEQADDQVNISSSSSNDENELIVGNGVKMWTDEAVSDENSSSSSKNWIAIDTVDLSHNNITTLTAVLNNVSSSPSCILQSVFILDLSFNRLESLQSPLWSLCRGFRSLREINASRNDMKELDMSSFPPLQHLISLDLSFNQLQLVWGDSFQHIVSLKHLFLNDNQLSRIIDVFPSLPSLTTLDLSNNQLTYLHTDVFARLSSLQKLILSNNQITFLAPTIFASLNHLTELSVDHNHLQAIDTPVFQNTSLRRLNISFMPRLTNISHDTFSGLSQLIDLNMSHNPNLDFLPPNILSGLTHLETLDISNNGFQQISQITFLRPSLRKVYLNRLPLTCECTNSWMPEEILKENSVFANLNMSQCLDKNGQPHAISEASFNCGEVYINNATTGKVDVPLGSKLMLQCQQVSDEFAVLTWTTPTGEKFYHHDFHPSSLLHLMSPDQVSPGAPFHKNHYWHQSTSYHSEISSNSERIIILTDGSLYIDYMLRTDTGDYSCQVSNSQFNQSITVTLHLVNEIGGRIKIIAFAVGFLCAISFFLLNVVYVIISWVARRLVNKRRRAIIMQMLESLNSYKSVQVSRIHDNYLHQLNRVRNQYHIQRDKLHKNYTGQVTKVKRGCSNQVEKVRDNYHSKLTTLREYSSRQIVQIRDGANNQIARIRDYGSLQLERLRETYKLQQQHVLKLLDTMNLDNCRSVVETECMRTESMMFDIDLLEPDVRIDSPTMSPDSEYSTANSSPTASDGFILDLGDDNDDEMVRNDDEDADDEDESQHDGDKTIEIEMNSSLAIPGTGLKIDAKEVWKYTGDGDNSDTVSDHVLYTNVHDQNESPIALNSNKRLQSEMVPDKKDAKSNRVEMLPHSQHATSLENGHQLYNTASVDESQNDSWAEDFVTPNASPIKRRPNNSEPRVPTNICKVNIDEWDCHNGEKMDHEESKL